MNGEVTVTDGVVSQIVVRAAQSVEGARVRRRPGRRKPVVELPRVEIELAVAYGRVLPDVARDVQARVTEALAQMCEVDAVVDVSVEEIDA